MRICAFDKTSTEGAGVGEVCLEVCIAVYPLLFFGEDGHVIARIVGELVSVADAKRLRRAEHRRERLRVRLKESWITNLLHHAFGAIHRKDIGCLDHLVAADERFAVLVVVAVNRERKAFEKSAIHAGWVAEVYWRAENKHIRLTRTFENGAQIIAYGTYAVRLGVLELAGEAALAAGEADVVEVDKFRFGTCFLGTRFRRLKHLGGVPTLARAAVKEHCEWFVVFHFASWLVLWRNTDSLENPGDAYSCNVIDYKAVVVELVEVHDGRGELAPVGLDARERLRTGERPRAGPLHGDRPLVGDHVLKLPLDVWETRPHHRNDAQISLCAIKRIGRNGCLERGLCGN